MWKPSDTRLANMKLAVAARIAQAGRGVPWARDPPWGRAYDSERGEWYVTEEGQKLRELLTRYIDGELLTDLAAEYGFSPREVWRHFRQQVTGTYVVTFNAPEIGIVNLEVPVPSIPEVISPDLKRRVKARREQSPDPRRMKRYVLTGFVRCAKCNSRLSGTSYGRHQYYQHSTGSDKAGCEYDSIRSDLLETVVLDRLFEILGDQFEAVCQSLPDASRKLLERLAKQAETRPAKNEGWRKLSHDDVRRVLYSLLGRRGILAGQADRKWRITIKGPVIGAHHIERPVESRYRGLKSYPYHNKSPSPAAD